MASNSLSQYKMRIYRSGIFSLLIICIVACQTVPLTGRSQLILISEQDELTLGLQSYQKVLKESKLSQDSKITEMVRRVGMKLAQVADRPDYQWEFNVIEDDKTVNAFCLPGGKVAVYTGILPITRDETGLAVVLSHEIGHAIARHGAERISTQELVQIGEIGLVVALGAKDPETINAIDSAYGIGTGVGVILPFSRSQESEADHIGLILMAKAGYNPQVAVEFWQRMMTAQKDKNAPPEFLSTHPSDERRIRQIQQWLPEVSNNRQSISHNP
jgi:predicted Zn-dependent protease